MSVNQSKVSCGCRVMGEIPTDPICISSDSDDDFLEAKSSEEFVISYLYPLI